MGKTLLFSILILSAVCFFAASASAIHPMGPHDWSDSESGLLRSLWIGSLPDLPVDPSNRYSSDPKAAQLGKKFFFDNRFSGNGSVSCSTCHRPDMQFTDNLPLAHGMGTTNRRSMPLMGAAYNTWLFWDGRVDSLWAQALQPPESPQEHGITRTHCARIIDKYYHDEFEAVFGPLPRFTEQDYPTIAKPSPGEPAAYEAWKAMSPEKRDEINHIFVNFGKAIAAYVRLIMPGESRFDRYVKAVLDGDSEKAMTILSAEEVMGLRLFIGKAKCTNCHNGPLFTNGDFHNLDIPKPQGLPEDRGRADGMRRVFSSLFNCMGKYSDADPEMDCAELRYMDTDASKYVGAFKTPSLRNVAGRPPYMHAGQFATISDVLAFYQRSHNPELGHNDLTDEEMKHIEEFLLTLTGPVIELEPGKN